ncbi:metal-sensing transcriptional repressor [Methanobrevibacter sp. OttesenSCG-928-K11]|nr:metal-sensing transcriptional repressor [Methanobrevibacter sp. OttesenSCG-928-K11]MDL2270502.1 metal-sensing transcriptional repressor [Methanobrevibacter sp. OttesenSCG-928-I08]
MKKCMDSENLHIRLNKIKGQINAIDRMIDEDIRCEDILMQVNASKSALHKVGQVILEGHLQHCVKEGIESGDTDQTVENFAKAIEYFSRL